ncbi:unnamed protein product [Protopolystoma xenopodis]|uniref:Uncharacterized protein n=1 Tax=Protopolystoma xenopodis TaxID=117903 RepID=A0A3S4ZPG5_9PLAT|nr:unnamed protein product [Protopolystoma xenopodis]
MRRAASVANAALSSMSSGRQNSHHQYPLRHQSRAGIKYFASSVLGSNRQNSCLADDVHRGVDGEAATFASPTSGYRAGPLPVGCCGSSCHATICQAIGQTPAGQADLFRSGCRLSEDECFCHNSAVSGTMQSGGLGTFTRGGPWTLVLQMMLFPFNAYFQSKLPSIGRFLILGS